MDIRELNEIGFRYVRIRLDGHTERYENINFTELLKYIGKHYPINNRNPIGCAYVKICKETDKLLHVSWTHNWKIRTSKKEVSSIRLAKYWALENKKNHYYIRIPYKISFIFTAVINIVSELAETHPIPPELNDCIGKAYGLSFYGLHMDKYLMEYHRKFRHDCRTAETMRDPARLFDEFESPASVFRQIFP